MGTNQADATGKLALSPLEKDAIGEVMNISMGSAATAVSQMLDKQVEITTPTVNVQTVESVKYEQLEPAILVKIVYTQGLTGANVMVFRQHDMQMILNALMGISEEPKDDFVFDDLSISAACEVMNQMMGSSSTALADFLDKKIDISTPEASVMDEENSFLDSMELSPDTEVATVTFKLTIKGMLESEFISVMEAELVKEIISRFINKDGDVQAPESAASQAAAPVAAMPESAAPPPAAPAAAAPPPPVAPSPAAAAPPPQAVPTPPPPVAPAPAAAFTPPPAPTYAPAAAQSYGTAVATAMAPPPQAYAAPSYSPPPPAVDVRPVEFPEFSQNAYAEGAPVMGTNLDLIMNVPLAVSIEIGTTKRKIRDIMNFTSGTVVELEKQAGSPVDIVVNGQLIAHGDVVVIDDNFGVRITEIVGTKDLINSLSESQG